MYRSVPALVLLMLALQACGSGDSRSAQPAKGFERDASVHEQVLDHDGDGLCDSSERDFGTDRRAADSDGDGLPDLIELANGFDAVNRDEPGPDELPISTPSRALRPISQCARPSMARVKV